MRRHCRQIEAMNEGPQLNVCFRSAGHLPHATDIASRTEGYRNIVARLERHALGDRIGVSAGKGKRQKDFRGRGRIGHRRMPCPKPLVPTIAMRHGFVMKHVAVRSGEPLWREIPYADPITLARRLRNRPYFTFLDSSLRHESHGRYSYICCDPVLTI